MKRLAYRDTAVPVERSQKAIRDLLQAYGASGVQFTEEFQASQIMVRFAYIPEPDGDKKGRAYFIRLKAQVPEASRQTKREAMQRASWRVLRAQESDGVGPVRDREFRGGVPGALRVGAGCHGQRVHRRGSADPEAPRGSVGADGGRGEGLKRLQEE